MKEQESAISFSQDDLSEKEAEIDIRKIGIFQYRRPIYYIIGAVYYVASHQNKSPRRQEKQGKKWRRKFRSLSDETVRESKYIIDYHSMKDPLFLQAVEMIRQNIPCIVYYEITRVNKRGIRYVRIVKIHSDSYRKYIDQHPEGPSLEEKMKDSQFVAQLLAYIAEQLKKVLGDPQHQTLTGGEEEKVQETFSSPPPSRYTPKHRRRSRKH